MKRQSKLLVNLTTDALSSFRSPNRTSRSSTCSPSRSTSTRCASTTALQPAAQGVHRRGPAAVPHQRHQELPEALHNTAHRQAGLFYKQVTPGAQGHPPMLQSIALTGFERFLSK